MYIPKNFSLKEFLPKDFYEEMYPKYGNRLWLIFDRVGLQTVQQLRDTYGKMLCNDWPYGGKNQYRGYRPPSCKIGAPLSQHRFGRAWDLIPLETPLETIRQHILEGRWPTIRGLELNVSWLHIDFRNSDKLVTFTP